MKKNFIYFLPIFLISLASADDCSITNLGGCLAQKFFEFLLSVLNAPIQPLLDMTYNLLTQPVNISVFSDVWSIIVYILSMFYGLLLMYVGFRFILSGHSPHEREKSKSMLANILIMIVLVQASYYLYSLIINIDSALTTTILNMVRQDFFLLTIDNITNIGLQLILVSPYLLAVLLTLILLVLRYILVSAGVVLFAIGIFFYFIEPLNSYGRLIINFLIATISATFFYALIFLASSKILEINSFQNIKILVMIGAFSLVNMITLLILLFVIVQSALKVAQPIMKAVSLAEAVFA